MRIALFQLDTTWEDRKANLDKVGSLVKGIRDQDVDLVCLPELFSTGYTMSPAPLAEPLDGETSSFLANLAGENRINLVGSFIEKTAGKPRNSALAFNAHGKMIAHYSKIYLPTFLHEDEHYGPGDKVSVFEIGGTKFGMVICYDLRFPELFRKLVEAGVKGVFVIASWPTERIEHWDLLLRARAVDNQFFVIGVNRVGNSPIGSYPGHSAVVDPWGRVVASATGKQEKVLVAEIDFKLVEEVREKLPVLRDRL